MGMNKNRESIHEKVSHGKKTFPYALYHARIPEWLSGFPLHWHEEFEIILVTYGQGIFTVNGENRLCKKGDLVIIPPGTIHSIERNQKDYTEYFNILFSFSLLEENPESHCHRKFLSKLSCGTGVRSFFLSGSSSATRIAELAQDLINHREENYSGYELMIKSRLYEILFILTQENLACSGESSQSRKEEENSAKIKKVLAYTQEHFADKIGVAEAASICSLSESRFMTFFKSQTGTSYIQYLKDYRLEAAAEEIQGSRSEITRIALENGFDNISYFIRAFKEKFGCTPLAYRKKG